MLDPVQREVLAAARSGGVAVSGGPGTGKSRLANALAADAVSRGLRCLLVGDDEGLDMARDVDMSPPLHPTLAARTRLAQTLRSSFALGGGIHAQRASLNPAEAALALRLLRRAKEIQAEHGFGASEVSAAAVRRMPSPRTMALIGVTCADGALLADAFWNGNARSGRTLGDVVATLGGDDVGPASDADAIMAAAGGTVYENTVAALAQEADEGAQAVAGFADLRRVLDPWAWSNPQFTVSEMHSSLTARARAFANAANLLKANGSMETAIKACSFGDNTALALVNYRRSFPGIDGREAEAAIRRHSLREEGRADALAPFLGSHGSVRLAQVEAAVKRDEDQPDVLARLERLRVIRDAADRLTGLLVDLSRSLPPAALAVVHGKPLDAVLASVTASSEESDRSRALREVAGLRTNFAKTGFGDVLEAGEDVEQALSGARELDDVAHAAPDSPRMLDLLVDPAPAPVGAERPWTGFVRRWCPAQEPMPADGTRYDVVVVDDALSLGEADLDALRRLSPVMHLVGVERGAGIDLPVPHRSLAGTLANLGRPKAERGWAGGPGGGGVVVRTLPEGVDASDALMTALVAVRAAGQSAVDARGAQGTADVVILAMDRVGEADIKAAAARAGTAVLVLARECAWEPPAPPAAEIPEDERCLVASGWTLVANAEDGRVYAKGERSVIITDEPDGYGLVAETVAERVARLSAAGWSPVVAWRGSPRGAVDMLRVVERSAVPNGAALDMELATFPLPGPRRASTLKPIQQRPRKVRYEDIPASPHRDGSFQDVVWKLKWLREEILLKANPDLGACLLTDERILSLVRMGVDDEGTWQAKVRGAVLRGVDPKQIESRDVVIDVVGTMIRGNVVTEKLVDVLAVNYEPEFGLDMDHNLLEASEAPPAYMIPADATEGPRLGM